MVLLGLSLKTGVRKRIWDLLDVGLFIQEVQRVGTARTEGEVQASSGLWPDSRRILMKSRKRPGCSLIFLGEFFLSWSLWMGYADSLLLQAANIP